MTYVWHIYGQNHWFDLLSVSMMEGEKKRKKERKQERRGKGRKEEMKRGTNKEMKEWRKKGRKGMAEGNKMTREKYLM